MEIATLKKLYLDYYRKQGFQVLPSSSLVHQHLPTDFVMSVGLLQLEPILAGSNQAENHQDFTMVQRCIRSFDVQDAGKGSKLSFFEMAGAITLGSRSVPEVLDLLVDFLMENLKIPEERLFFTLYGGGEFRGRDLGRDEESFQSLVQKGVKESRIFWLGEKENLFGLPDREEYCGPCVETFYFQGDLIPLIPVFQPGKSIPQEFLEIGNTVLLSYQKTDGGLEDLPRVYAESALGVERTAQAILEKESLFVLPELASIKNALSEVFSLPKASVDAKRQLNITADHIRALTFAIADGGRPGHGGRRYVLRKIIRRFLVRIGLEQPDLTPRLKAVLDTLMCHNHHILTLSEEQRDEIVEVVGKELAVFKSGKADPEKYI